MKEREFFAQARGTAGLGDRDRPEYFIQLNPARVGQSGGFAVTRAGHRPNWFHRLILRLLLGWTVTERADG